MEQYLEFAKKLTLEAGEIASKYFSFEIEHTWKDDNTPLTLADSEINDLVIKRINEAYPEHSIYGEEKSDKKENSKYIWVCDPIDGTMAFANGLPIFAFSIALVDESNGLPVLGVVYDPIMKNMYTAIKNGGAYRNGKQISVLQTDILTNAYINIETSINAIFFSYMPIMESSKAKKYTVFKLPSFVYGGVQVANGKFVGAVYCKEYAHDIAALKIIIEEAGGKVTDLNGEERRYDNDGLGCIVSNGILHQEILDMIQAGKL